MTTLQNLVLEWPRRDTVNMCIGTKNAALSSARRSESGSFAPLRIAMDLA